MDWLEQQLRTADQAAGDAPLLPDLATRVRALHRRRQIRRRAAVPAAAVLLALIALPLFIRHQSARHIAELRAQLAQLDLQIAAQEERVAQAERDATAHPPQAPDPRLVAAQTALALARAFPPERAPAERAAAALLLQADRLARHDDLRPAAAADYAQVVKCFPSTLAAAEARQRLEQFHKEG